MYVFVLENEACFKAVLMKFYNYIISLKCFLCCCFHFRRMNISDRKIIRKHMSISCVLKSVVQNFTEVTGQVLCGMASTKGVWNYQPTKKLKDTFKNRQNNEVYLHQPVTFQICFIMLSPLKFTFLACYCGVSTLSVLLQQNSNTPLSETPLGPGFVMQRLCFS